MAHWAELDDNNIVLRVTVGSNDDPDEGYAWLMHNLGGRWVKTSYNGNIRGRFAGIGYTYDETLDEFLPPCPHFGWSWNSQASEWKAPIPMPTTPGLWEWSDEEQTWVR